MKKIFLTLSVIAACAQINIFADGPTNGIAASVHPLATQAGINAMKSGGNAIDAAVAIGLTLGVVDTHNSGIGGGCFMLIHLANGKNYCLDGREMAGAAATRDMFVRDGKGDTTLSQTGPLASGVPGEVAVFDYVEKHFGKKSLHDLLLPAADIAEHGFPLPENYAKLIVSEKENIEKYPATAALLLPDGKPLQAGDILKQPDLAKTYRSIAAQGSDWYYRGPFAAAVGKWMAANGGILTSNDYANYHIELREPISTTYRGYEIVSFPPPSSGGVHVLEMLNILENFDLKKMDEATRLHVIAEAMKLAFADRAYWLGDPAFVDVPRGLISKTYAAGLAKKISLTTTMPLPEHGLPPDWQTDLFKKHTTHFCTADAEGNWVTCTATINTSFGSKVVIPGTGVTMNNQMDDFSIQPGVANHFGLVGAEANAVAPGKRPLSSMSPAIVFKDGQPIIGLGAAGGPKIITAVLQEIVDMIDLGETPTQAVRAPRIHEQWSPDELYVEKRLPEDLKKQLAARGHKITELPASAVSQIVARAPDGKSFVGAADPRSNGTAEGW
ncbi:MAG TPA: gamma-glutamyltransferase [Candidatus Sulfotelmatobacter sp.]|jgi:gamma-glutamyltranspeptidase/glutathione hydrolase|nr:gamma-glutamyltransferase [Candidatus Sulfotelmatobacter sp.]